MWFTYAKTDTNKVAVKEECSIPTIERLKKANAKDLHVSELEKVVDESKQFNKDGLPYSDGDELYEYNGHWSWIYAQNNWLKDGDLTLWSWLSNQVKVSNNTENTTKPTNMSNSKNNTVTASVKTGDNISFVTYISLLVLAVAVFISIKKYVF